MDGSQINRYNPRDKIIKESDFHRTLTEKYLWWVNKRNEILGQMIEDGDFARYVFAYKDIDSPHIDVDKEFLEKAILYINALEDEMDDELMNEGFSS